MFPSLSTTTVGEWWLPMLMNIKWILMIMSIMNHWTTSCYGSMLWLARHSATSRCRTSSPSRQSCRSLSSSHQWPVGAVLVPRVEPGVLRTWPWQWHQSGGDERHYVCIWHCWQHEFVFTCAPQQYPHHCGRIIDMSMPTMARRISWGRNASRSRSNFKNSLAAMAVKAPVASSLQRKFHPSCVQILHDGSLQLESVCLSTLNHP